VQFLFTLLFAIIGISFVFAQGISVSGIFESYVSTNYGTGNAPPTSSGLEEYANIRMQAKIGERATFFGAVNFIAASGDYALGMVADTSNVTDKNYLAIMELERLYFKLNFEYESTAMNIDGGLMRLPFGYSQVWGSSDFLNPKNPLLPYARPRAILGLANSLYLTDSFKFQQFIVAPSNPFARNDGKTISASERHWGIAGVAAEQHWDIASVQMLYSHDFPDSVSKGFHRAGMSMKADLELGLLVDMLYTYSKGMENKKDGLSLSAGFDYSLFSGNLLILTEYLYNGAASTTSIAGGGSFFNENYLYTGLTWRFNDYTNAGAALISGLDDKSFMPVVNFSYDIIQGANFSLRAQVPIDNDLLHENGKHGEFGPLPPGRDAGSKFYMEGRLQLRF
jgi:hypothetical protein